MGMHTSSQDWIPSIHVGKDIIVDESVSKSTQNKPLSQMIFKSDIIFLKNIGYKSLSYFDEIQLSFLRKTFNRFHFDNNEVLKHVKKRLSSYIMDTPVKISIRYIRRSNKIFMFVKFADSRKTIKKSLYEWYDILKLYNIKMKIELIYKYSTKLLGTQNHKSSLLMTKYSIDANIHKPLNNLMTDERLWREYFINKKLSTKLDEPRLILVGVDWGKSFDPSETINVEFDYNLLERKGTTMIVTPPAPANDNNEPLRLGRFTDIGIKI